jgi:hypothetical protein
MTSILQAVHDDIQENLDDIFALFREVTQEEPWIKLPHDFHLDHLPPMIRVAAELSLQSPGDRELVRQLIREGCKHGETRLEQAFPEAILFHEHQLVRNAIWYHIRGRHRGEGLVFEAMIRLDAALTLATRATLRGFHRVAFARLGRWPSALEELESAWRPLPSLE